MTAVDFTPCSVALVTVSLKLLNVDPVKSG